MSNEGQEPIINAYAKVARVVEHTHYNINGERVASDRELYKDHDIFLHWEATEGRLHSFHRRATLLLARGESGGRYHLCVIGDVLFPPPTANGAIYEITIEIASDNTPTLTTTVSLAMESVTTTDKDGRLVPYLDLPYAVTFKEVTAQ